MLISEVRTRRLVLRPFKESDFENWFECWVNHLPSASKWDQGPLPVKKCSWGYFKKLVKRLKELAKADDYYRYGVFEKKSGTLVGQIDFDIYARGSHQFSNFGYVVYNRYWGQGFGQEAATAGLKIGFKKLKLNRLEAAINLDNRKSIRLARAIGMRREGIKKRYWFEDGKWVDHLIYVANPEDLGMRGNKLDE